MKKYASIFFLIFLVSPVLIAQADCGGNCTTAQYCEGSTCINCSPVCTMTEYCSDSTKKCANKSADATCDYNYQCLSNVCDTTTKTCQKTTATPPVTGGAATDSGGGAATGSGGGKAVEPGGGKAATDTAATAITLPNYIGTNDPNVIVGRVIKYIIGIAGTATLVVFIYGGVLWLTARGEPSGVTKGKDAMMNAIIGLIILFSSYVIVKFIYAALSSASV